MKKPTLTIAVAAALLAATGAVTVHADPGSASRPGSGWAISAKSDASPVGGESEAVAGGVGLNARAMLSNDEASDHNVKLVFSLTSGNYLADVHVKVIDASGRTVIDGMSDGPWLYAKLPPGKYVAAATYAGHTVTENLTVGKRTQRTAHFRWPDSIEHQMTARSDVSPILGTGPQELSARQ
jgi:hypothetical protein